MSQRTTGTGNYHYTQAPVQVTGNYHYTQLVQVTITTLRLRYHSHSTVEYHGQVKLAQPSHTTGDDNVETSTVLRLQCSLDSLSIDSAHVIYVSEGYDVAV